MKTSFFTSMGLVLSEENSSRIHSGADFKSDWKLELKIRMLKWVGTCKTGHSHLPPLNKNNLKNKEAYK
jgi:hypothetical protein